MSITLLWDNSEHTVLRYVFDEPWDWNEFYSTLEKGAHAKNSRNCIIDSIYDMERNICIPPGAFSQFRRIAKIHHRNDGVYIGIANTPLAHSVLNSFCLYYGEVATRYYLVDSLKAARLIVAKQRAWRKQHTHY